MRLTSDNTKSVSRTSNGLVTGRFLHAGGGLKPSLAGFSMKERYDQQSTN
jgi:hypothetical protein